MNTVRKGNNNQRRCYKELQKYGYTTWVAKRSRYGGNDYLL